ncbi:MAG: hypothetical protein KC656_36245, partial [Myxococcales bacterium]|nr:hypothetical protein [Myxococcales bacterium]
GRLDAAPRQSHVALVVPEGAVQIAGCPGGNGSARCLGDVRVGLSAALLAAGFELHDAGAVLLPALGIVSSGEVAWAAQEQLQEAGHGKAAAAPSAPEVSVTVNASTTGEAGASEVATGVVLDDATSMWAHELGTVDELGRQLALRVFFVDVQQMDLPAPTAMELSPTQLVAFDRLAEDWNIDRDRWVASRNQATEEHIRWGDAWNAYEEEHGEWRRAYRSSIAAFDVPSQPVPRPSLVRLPDAPPRASRDTVLQLLAAHRGILRRVVGTLGVELVDMRTGRVLWVARASG